MSTLVTEKHLSQEEEERLWMISVVPLIPILIYAIIYLGVNVLSFEIAFRYVLLTATLCLFAGFGIYEIASSFKVKKPLSFRVKRVLSRTVFAGAYFLGFYVFWVFFSVLFLGVLKLQYILLLSLLTVTFTLVALVKNPKTRRLIKKLTQEN